MRKPWFWVGVILLAAFAAMLLASLAYGGSGEREVVEKLVVDAKLRWSTPHVRTSAIHGDMHDGDALSDYVAAAESLRQVATQFAKPIPASSRPEVRGLIDPVIVALRRATSCRTVRRIPRGLTVDDGVLANVVSVACSSLLEDGKDLEAVRVWLDAVAFTVVLQSRESYNYQRSDEALANGWTDADLAALSEDARRLLVAGLLWAEDALLEPTDWRLHLIGPGMLALNPRAFARVNLVDRLSAWRAGFSPQRASLREVAAVAENLDVLDAQPASWTARCEQFEAFQDALEAEGVVGTGYLYELIDGWRRVMIARLRLLRIAIALHSGQELGPVANPLGDGAIPVVRGRDSYVLRVGQDLHDCERVVRK